MLEYRCEEKYMLPPPGAAVCTERMRHQLSALLCKDSHQGDRAYYTIRSLYFDDYEDSAYYQTLAGADRRCKFRLRLYNGDAHYIRLEIKSKLNGYTHKEGCRITPEQCLLLMHGRTLPFSADDPLPLRRWNLEARTHLLRPRIIVEYRRCAFATSVGNVRVTIDEDIRYHTDPRQFLNARISSLPVAPALGQLLEVKYDELLPGYVADSLQTNSLRKTAFSKYVTCREASIE